MPQHSVNSPGQAILGGLGKGLTALVPLLIQAQQQQMAQIELQFKIDANKQVNLKTAELIEDMNKTPADIGREKAEEETAQIQAGLFGTALEGTPQGGILTALGAEPGGENAASVPQLQEIIGAQTGTRPLLDTTGFDLQPKQSTRALTRLETIEREFGIEGLRKEIDPNTTPFKQGEVIFEGLGRDPQRFMDFVLRRGEFEKTPQFGAVDQLLIEKLGEKRFGDFKAGTGEFERSATRLELINEMFGAEGVKKAIDPFAEKGLAPKDKAVVEDFKKEFPEDIAKVKIQNFLSGKDPDKDAFSRYKGILNTITGGLFSRIEGGATVEQQARAAQESGYSPVLGGTEFDRMAKVGQMEKANVLTKKQADNRRKLIKEHFADLGGEVRRYFEQLQPFSAEFTTEEQEELSAPTFDPDRSPTELGF